VAEPARGQAAAGRDRQALRSRQNGRPRRAGRFFLYPLIPANAGTQIPWRCSGLEKLNAFGVNLKAIPSGSRHSPG
jgi:hypothetical protein